MTAPINFTKMHGIGNDFVIIDARIKNNKHWLDGLSPSQLASNMARLCDRHRGIGCDQLIVLKNPPADNNLKLDIAMVIFNHDGSVAQTCGNATRCVAQIMGREKNKKEIYIDSHGRLLSAVLLANNMVAVNMGVGVYDWQKIPLSQDCDTMNLPLLDMAADKGGVTLRDIFKQYNFAPLAPAMAVNVGNPHCVWLVKNADEVAIEEIGKAIENHPLFPERTNVEFVSATSTPSKFRLRVWERGAGATLACGSGAVATFLALHRLAKITDKRATMVMDGGALQLAMNDDEQVIMSGPAEFVFAGEFAPN